MLRARILVALCIFAFAAFLAGCGDSEGSTATVTETATVSDATATEETATEETVTAEETGEATDGGVPPADQTVDELTAFSSPSGNIGCVIDRESVRCDISDRDWEPPAAPADCKLDYGQGIQLSAGAAPDFVCAGDTTLGGGSELAYGQSIAAGLLRCESEESGVTCTDTETGRGFTIAQEAYELF